MDQDDSEVMLATEAFLWPHFIESCRIFPVGNNLAVDTLNQPSRPGTNLVSACLSLEPAQPSREWTVSFPQSDNATAHPPLRADCRHASITCCVFSVISPQP